MKSTQICSWILVIPTLITLLFVLAFSSEFIHHKFGAIGVPASPKVLKLFNASSSHTSNQSVVLSHCKDYCARSNKCWGCTKHCSVTCHWNAIEIFDQTDEATEMIQAHVSQKPGNY